MTHVIDGFDASEALGLCIDVDNMLGALLVDPDGSIRLIGPLSAHGVNIPPATGMAFRTVSQPDGTNMVYLLGKNWRIEVGEWRGPQEDLDSWIVNATALLKSEAPGASAKPPIWN